AIARSHGVIFGAPEALSGIEPVTTTADRRVDASPWGVTSRQLTSTIRARMSQSVRMRRPRSAGADQSTGTYAAPAFRTPKIATTAGRPFGNTMPTRAARDTPRDTRNDASAR